ncbi:MAG: hypothetical protein ACYCRH_12920 [Acidiferrobacteraceae bacterium]
MVASKVACGRELAAALLLGLLALAPVAHSAGIEVPCVGSPRAAVLRVPPPGNRFLRIVCTRFGAVLVPTAGWSWTRPGAYSPIFFPAQMVRTHPRAVGTTVFFQKIRVLRLTGAAAHIKWQRLAHLFPAQPAPDRALVIIAENNEGGRHIISLFPNGWGYDCTPRCPDEGVFLVIQANGRPPRW